MAENGSSNNPSEVMRGFCGNINYNFYLDKAITCLTSIVIINDLTECPLFHSRIILYKKQITGVDFDRGCQGVFDVFSGFFLYDLLYVSSSWFNQIAMDIS